MIAGIGMTIFIAIIAGAVGGCCILVLCIVLCVCCCKRREQKKTPTATATMYDGTRLGRRAPHHTSSHTPPHPAPPLYYRYTQHRAQSILEEKGPPPGFAAAADGMESMVQKKQNEYVTNMI